MRDTATLTTVEGLLAAAQADLDPGGEHRDPALARLDRRIILICDEGYQSSLAAATLRRFGAEACDVIGGVQDWMAAGLPLEAPAAQSPPPR